MPVLIFSTEGGMEIEEVAEKNPGAIHKLPLGLNSIDDKKNEEIKKFLNATGIGSDAAQQITDITNKLYKLFMNKDCTQIEINPLSQTDTGEILCVDAKLNFDDNAFFRQKDLFAKRDYSQEDARDVEAAKNDLN